MRAAPARAALALAAVAAPFAVTPGAAAAQDAPGLVRVFLDCPETNCDDDFFQRALPWVSHVRDRTAADVHVLVTEQDAGGGGESFTAVFIGRGAFEGRRDTLRFVTAQDATDDDEREGLARIVGLGLAPFVSRSAAGEHLRVVYDVPAAARRPPARVADPWDSWVFRVWGSGFVEAESQFKPTARSGLIEG